MWYYNTRKCFPLLCFYINTNFYTLLSWAHHHHHSYGTWIVSLLPTTVTAVAVRLPHRHCKTFNLDRCQGSLHYGDRQKHGSEEVCWTADVRLIFLWHGQPECLLSILHVRLQPLLQQQNRTPAWIFIAELVPLFNYLERAYCIDVSARIYQCYLCNFCICTILPVFVMSVEKSYIIGQHSREINHSL